MNSDFRDLITSLNESSVKYLVVGGYAVVFYAQPRFTQDIDLFIADDEENIYRLRQAMVEFGFPLTEQAVQELCLPNRMISVGRAPSRIDILNHIPGLEFEMVWPNRVAADVEGTVINFIGLEGLIAAKRAASRPQDLIDLQSLERVRDNPSQG